MINHEYKENMSKTKKLQEERHKLSSYISKLLERDLVEEEYENIRAILSSYSNYKRTDVERNQIIVINGLKIKILRLRNEIERLNIINQ